MEEPRGSVGGEEGRTEGFGHSAHVPPKIEVELEQPVARNEIALRPIGVVHRAGSHMGNTEPVLDYLDFPAQPLAREGTVRLELGSAPAPQPRQRGEPDRREKKRAAGHRIRRRISVTKSLRRQDR